MNTSSLSTGFRGLGYFVTLIASPMLLWFTQKQTDVYQTLMEDMYGRKALLPPEVIAIIRINISDVTHWSLVALLVVSAVMLWRLRWPVVTAVLCSITLLAASLQLGLSAYFCSHFIETQVLVLEAKFKKLEKGEK
jgi:hypothetical protein